MADSEHDVSGAVHDSEIDVVTAGNGDGDGRGGRRRLRSLRRLLDPPASSRHEAERMAADELWDAITPAMDKMVAGVPGASSVQEAEAVLRRRAEEEGARLATEREQVRRAHEEAQAAAMAVAAERARTKCTEHCRHVFLDGACAGTFAYHESEKWRVHFCTLCGTGHRWDDSLQDWVPASPATRRAASASAR